MKENIDRPDRIEVRGARVHNLKNIDVDVPLGKVVGIAGGVGLGQELAGPRGTVCGGIAALSRVAVDIYPPENDSGGAGERG